MILQKQTIGGLDEDRHGNCFSTCVACLVNLPVSQVPNFMSTGRKKYDLLGEFLAEKGYEFNGFWYYPPVDWASKFKGVDGYAIVGGPSPRPYVGLHAVIYKNGVPFWDPHTDETFTLGVKRVFLITKKQQNEA